MKKYAVIAIAAALISAAPAYHLFQAKAGDTAALSTEVYPYAKCRATVEGEKMSGYCWDNDAMAPKDYELADGTKVSVEDKDVYVVTPDGRMTPAPDGEHVTKEGKKLVTKDGMLIE